MINWPLEVRNRLAPKGVKSVVIVADGGGCRMIRGLAGLDALTVNGINTMIFGM
jgi:hypothetical protein